jgi:hypothetical protein
MIVEEEVKVKPKPAKALVQKGVEDVYYVEKKGEKYIALGGKPEPTDTDNWGVLCRELGEEASITAITRVKGPLYRNGTNYYHVRTDQKPSNRDAVVMGFTIWELSTLKNKDFTLKRAMSLFPPPIPPQPPLPPPTPPPPPPPPPPPQQQVWPVDNDLDGKGTCILSMAILVHKKLLYVEIRKGKYRPFGGKCESGDSDSYEAIRRMISEAVGEKEQVCIWGPVTYQNIAYRGIRVDHVPVAQEGHELKSFTSIDEMQSDESLLHYCLKRIICILTVTYKDDSSLIDDHVSSDEEPDIAQLLAAQQVIESATKKKRKHLDYLSGEKNALDALENTLKQVPH